MSEAWFRRRRLPGRLGAVDVARLLGFQVILVGLFPLATQRVALAILCGLLGAAAIAVTLGRWRGRWWTECALLWLRYRRRRLAAGPEREDPRLTALGTLVSDLAVEDVDGTEPGSRWGMASDGAGWFTVLEVDTPDASVHPPVPMSALARIAAEAEQPGVVMQVVSHTAPVGNGHPAGAQHTLWIAVRLDAEAVAESVVDDPDHQPHVPSVLAEITRRVGRALRRRGLPAQVLDADGVIDALLRSCDLRPADWQVREEWRAWHSERLAHRCYWLKAWPDPERGNTLLVSLNNLPHAQVSVALLLEPRYEATSADLRCLIRVAATPDRHQVVCDQVELLAERLRGGLFPLDGEHAPAVYGTAPSGGGAR